MKKVILVLLAALALAGCEKAPESSQHQGEFKIDKLFTADGCTMYRFYDNGRAVYYSNCAGSVQTTRQEGRHSVDVSVPTHRVQYTI